MKNSLKLSASAAAIALLLTAGAASTRAADIVEDPGCTLSGSVMAGYMFNWQDVSVDVENKFTSDSASGDLDWDTPFGEGAGLVTCGGFNIQADVAYYAHSGDIDFEGKDADVDQTNSHIGGMLFYRDPTSFAAGLGASWVSQSIDGKDIDVFRVGLFGELFLGDAFTLGASAYYYNTDWPEGKDEDGFELAAWGRFYATPDFSIMVRGDVLLGDGDFDFGADDAKWDPDGFAITGEAEYLVWDQGLSIFGGARYAERTLDIEGAPIGPPPDGTDFDFDIDDFQVFAGIKFYFGHQGTLIERHRTGTMDNTSVFHEKLPNAFVSGVLGAADIDVEPVP